MPAQWTAEIIGKMHLNGITATRLAEAVGWHPKYLSAVLNGRKNPGGAEERLRKALDMDGENVLVSGKPWALPKAWPGTEDSLTFGTDGDFFWQGEWTGDIVTDAEYSGGFYGYMNREYDNVFTISAVAKYSVIPHFEIMGK